MTEPQNFKNLGLFGQFHEKVKSLVGYYRIAEKLIDSKLVTFS
jgi:hypothetical protein